MTYKRLGDYIQQVNVRNTDLKDLPLLGVSISKNLIPSIANTIGTDMSSYKIIKKGQFAYGTVTSRNGDKISIALANEHEQALISQIYIVFEVIDKEKLLPEYLMMWFSRPEFDRYARYHSHGSTRETFDWADMCEVMLPIPNIETQRHIVAQYQAIEQKIKTNEALCEKLEATAQALYKHWFVDFEFLDENAQPYKSHGGAMTYNQELEKEIPEGWKVKSLGEIAEIKAGGDKPKIFSEIKTKECPIPIYANGIENNGLFGYTNEAKYPEKSITISARGTIGYSVLREEAFVGIVRLIIVIPKNKYEATYLIQYFNNIEFSQTGSVQNQLTIPQVSTIQIIVPADKILEEYDKKIDIINREIRVLTQQSQTLKKLQSLLLSRMAGVVEKIL